MSIAPDMAKLHLDSVIEEIADCLQRDARSHALDLLRAHLDGLLDQGGFIAPFLAMLRKTGSRATALFCVVAVLEKRPKNVDLALFRVELLLKLGKFENARKALENLSDQAHRPAYWRHKVALEVGMDALVTAPEDIADAVPHQSDGPVARHAQIKTLIARGQWDEAAAQSAQARAKFPNNPRLANQHVHILRARIGARQALGSAQEIAARFPGALYAQLGLADCLRAAGQRGAAMAHLEQTCDGFPRAVLPHLRLARMYLDLGDRDRALARVEHCLTLDPGTVHVELTYVDVLVRLGRRDTAVARLIKLVENDQATPGILIKLIANLKELHRRQDVADYVALALRMFPDHAELQHRFGAPDAETAHVGAAKRQGPEARRKQARAALEALDPAAALDMLRVGEMARREPDDINLIVRALMMQGRLLQAWRYMRSCLRIWPAEPALLDLFSQAANKTGRQAASIKVLEALAEAQPGEAPVLYSNLALLHAALGDADAGFAAYRACRDHGGFLQKNAFRLLMRSLLAEGRSVKLDALIKAQEASGLWKHPHPQKAFHGQLVTEAKIALACGEDGPARKVGQRDRAGHVALMRDYPDSNVSAIRATRQWLKYATPALPPLVNQIPRQIVQYWDKPSPPDRIAAMMQSWAAAEGFTHQVFDRAGTLRYLRETHGADVQRAFRLARNPAEEADFLRLCLLAEQGGVYADADDRLIGDLYQVLPRNAAFVAVVEPGLANFGNNFLAAVPGHPIMVDARDSACDALLARAAETTWSKTGPGLLTRAVARGLTQGPKAKAGDGIVALGLADITGVISIHNVAEHKMAANDWRGRS